MLVRLHALRVLRRVYLGTLAMVTMTLHGLQAGNRCAGEQEKAGGGRPRREARAPLGKRARCASRERPRRAGLRMTRLGPTRLPRLRRPARPLAVRTTHAPAEVL